MGVPPFVLLAMLYRLMRALVLGFVFAKARGGFM
jgi:hypothetical protein